MLKECARFILSKQADIDWVGWGDEGRSDCRMKTNIPRQSEPRDFDVVLSVAEELVAGAAGQQQEVRGDIAG